AASPRLPSLAVPFLFSSLRRRRPPCSTLFPYTTLFRSLVQIADSALFRRTAGAEQPAVLRVQAEAVAIVGAAALAAEQLGLETRSEEHTSELQSRFDLVCRLLLEKKKKKSDMRRKPGKT